MKKEIVLRNTGLPIYHWIQYLTPVSKMQTILITERLWSVFLLIDLISLKLNADSEPNFPITWEQVKEKCNKLKQEVYLTRDITRGIIAPKIRRRRRRGRSCAGSTAPAGWPATQTTTTTSLQIPLIRSESDASSKIEDTRSLIAARLMRRNRSNGSREEEREAPVATTAPTQHDSLLLNFMSLRCLAYSLSIFSLFALGALPRSYVFFFSCLFFNLWRGITISLSCLPWWRGSCCVAGN